LTVETVRLQKAELIGATGSIHNTEDNKIHRTVSASGSCINLW